MVTGRVDLFCCGSNNWHWRVNSRPAHLSHQCVSDEELNLSLWIQLGLIFYIYPLEQLQPVSVERWTHHVLQQQLSCRHFPASDWEPNVRLLWIISCSSDKKKNPSELTGNKRQQPRGNQPEPDKTTHFRLLLHKHSHIVPPVTVYSHGCCCRASANTRHVKHMMSPGESAGDVPATTGDTEHTDTCCLHSRCFRTHPVSLFTQQTEKHTRLKVSLALST